MTETVTVHVPLGARAYDVRIGAGLVDRTGAEIAPFLRRPRVAIVTDESVAALHLDRLQSALNAQGIASDVLRLPSGEATKSWTFLSRTVEWLLERKIERRDVVIAFGGGVIGDLVGFAAAILRRGVRFVQIPTTLLAQVDSSVGGKTGINSPHGKNLIGAFHQPTLVLADMAILDTLPRRDFLAGYGEVVKYGLLGDTDFFAWLEENGPRLQQDTALRQRAVAHSVAMRWRRRRAIPTGCCMARAWPSAVRWRSICPHGWGCAARRRQAVFWPIWQRWGCLRACPIFPVICQMMPR